MHNRADLAAHAPSAMPPPRLRRRCSARRARALAAGRLHQPTSLLPRLRRWWWGGVLPRASVAWVPPPASTATLLPRRRSTSNSLPSSMMTPAEDAVSGRAALAGHSPYSSPPPHAPHRGASRPAGPGRAQPATSTAISLSAANSARPLAGQTWRSCSATAPATGPGTGSWGTVAGYAVRDLSRRVAGLAGVCHGSGPRSRGRELGGVHSMEDP